MAAKIDLEKAYDRIDGEFVQEVVMKIGFGHMLTSVVLKCLQLTRMPVHWKGD